MRELTLTGIRHIRKVSTPSEQNTRIQFCFREPLTDADWACERKMVLCCILRAKTAACAVFLHKSRPDLLSRCCIRDPGEASRCAMVEFLPLAHAFALFSYLRKHKMVVRPDGSPPKSLHWLISSRSLVRFYARCRYLA
jgi:hypothetical protein